MASCVFERTTSSYENSSGTNLSHHLNQLGPISEQKQIADNNIDLCGKFVEVIINMRLMFNFFQHDLSNIGFLKIGRAMKEACFHLFQLLYHNFHTLTEFQFN